MFDGECPAAFAVGGRRSQEEEGEDRHDGSAVIEKGSRRCAVGASEEGPTRPWPRFPTRLDPWTLANGSSPPAPGGYADWCNKRTGLDGFPESRFFSTDPPGSAARPRFWTLIQCPDALWGAFSSSRERSPATPPSNRRGGGISAIDRVIEYLNPGM